MTQACWSCKTELDVGGLVAGNTVTCSSCGKVVTVDAAPGNVLGSGAAAPPGAGGVGSSEGTGGSGTGRAGNTGALIVLLVLVAAAIVTYVMLTRP